jgi:hypothetical protein
MKSSTLFSLAFVVNIASAVKFVNGPSEWIESSRFNKSHVPEVVSRAYKRSENRHEARSKVTAPAMQQLKSRTPHIPGSKTVKLRYGPYHVPGAPW